jgi:hypothetical protein
MSPEMLAAFDKWLAEHGDTLAIPMIVVTRTSGSIKFTLDGITDAIEVMVLCDGIFVTVNYQGECWDILAEFECVPVLVPGGIACGHCDPADRIIYPTHQMLFVEHVFQPFAEWIETTLVPAEAIGLDGNSGDGTAWAGLLPTNQTKDYSIIVPLRSNPVHGCRSH